MSCRFIPSGSRPSTSINNMRECINHCASTALNPEFGTNAGITSISSTDLTLACFCIERPITMGTPDPSQCRPCPDGSGYLCGSFYGPLPSRPSSIVKSIVFYDAVSQPIDVVVPLPGPQPPSPSSAPSPPPSDSSQPPPPPRPENPDPRPIITETSGSGNTDPDSNTNPNPNSPINNPSQPIITDGPVNQDDPAAAAPPASLTQVTVITSFITGTDGSITARPATIVNVIQNTAIQPINNPLQSGFSGVTPAAGAPSTNSTSTSPNVAILAGGICAAFIAVVGAVGFFFVRRSSRKNRKEAVTSFRTADGRFGDDFKKDGAKKDGSKESVEEFVLRGDGTVVGRDGTVHTIVQRDGTVLTVVQRDATLHGNNAVVHRNETTRDAVSPLTFPTPVTYTSEKPVKVTYATKHDEKTGLFSSPIHGAPSTRNDTASSWSSRSETSSSRSAKVASYVDDYTKDSYDDDYVFDDKKTDVFPEKKEKYNKAIEAGFVAVPGRARRAGGRVGEIRESVMEDAPPRYSMGAGKL
ncbi:hypothetical protein BC829DRAFT_469715 [Chytridium lagenaria]|nr:hypothetical protein BC829DRAFT_469715 [Chytridium lagenaria]